LPATVGHKGKEKDWKSRSIVTRFGVWGKAYGKSHDFRGGGVGNDDKVEKNNINYFKNFDKKR
jgi:hypothetical protein